jgi:hypothetical protein
MHEHRRQKFVLQQTMCLLCLLLRRDHSNARFVASAACHSIRLLPADATKQLDTQLAHLSLWSGCVPALYLSHGYCRDAGMVPTLLLSLLHQQLFASVAYTAALQVAQAGDAETSATSGWETVQQVCAFSGCERNDCGTLEPLTACCCTATNHQAVCHAMPALAVVPWSTCCTAFESGCCLSLRCASPVCCQLLHSLQHRNTLSTFELHATWADTQAAAAGMTQPAAAEADSKPLTSRINVLKSDKCCVSELDYNIR